MTSVLQPWIENLTYMEQSVLLTAIRGPDGLPKGHIAKSLLKWYRRSILKSAFLGQSVLNPCDKDGGSFTGPSCPESEIDIWPFLMDEIVAEYLGASDELPYHFQNHLMHASEILGYKHPNMKVRAWWNKTYFRIVKSLHLTGETEEQMDFRLSDNVEKWKATRWGDAE